ncbi:methionine synthase reductase-like [Anopheles aquasalis]|uniref:methionine synthase reductase-like n=1 Tax=Anopheles aquasalis TaxID=42839 RepID=UPI00215A4DC5|nr:methionine synthase reductase-like [Anopheles aquasalis]
MRSAELVNVIEEYDGRQLSLPPVPVSFIKLEQSDDTASVPAAEHLQAGVAQPFAATKVLTGTVKSTAKLCEGADVKTVYDVQLGGFEQTEHRHWPGDTVGILTYNLREDVQYLLDHLGFGNNDAAASRADSGWCVEVDKGTTKKAAKVPPFVPTTVTLRRLFAECLDLRAIPKKAFLRALASYTTDTSERRFLEILCSKEGSAEYEKIILKHGKGFLSLLKLVPSCLPPASLLVEHLPRLMPRPYSIANAYREDATRPVIRFLFSHNPIEPGITTTYLQGVKLGSLVHFYFRQSSDFTYKDSELANDVVMVGTGTGISPYLAFLEHRAAALESGRVLGKAQLIVGFRYRDRSYLCREEIAEYVRRGVLDGCREAFSRDGDARFKYVQDCIVEHRAAIEQTMAEGSIFYVCGDSKLLLPQIADTFTLHIISGGGNAALAASTVKALKSAGKYREDVWL